MKYFIAFLIFVTAQICQAQKKTFISPNLEYLEFINDSTLWTSIIDDGDTTSWFIKTDTLFIKKVYWRTGIKPETEHIVEWSGYKILQYSTDTISILYDRVVLSKRCTMKWVHALLFDYLFDLETNKGVAIISTAFQTPHPVSTQ